MRTIGQWTRKVRSMASDFQNQFQEAMREAEMTDLKKQVDDMAQDVNEFRSAQGACATTSRAWARTSKRSLGPTPEPAPALLAAGAEPGADGSAGRDAARRIRSGPLPAAETPVPALPEAPSEQPAREMESVGAGAADGHDGIHR